jgi:predicted metal-dependent phosphotriesterase family hydrolase
VKEVLELLDAGYEKNLLLADDSTIQPLKISEEIGQLMKEHWLTEADAAKIKTMIYRSMGLGRSVSRFVPKLRKAGVKEKTLHTILYDNPRRFLAFEPKDS